MVYCGHFEGGLCFWAVLLAGWVLDILQLCEDVFHSHRIQIGSTFRSVIYGGENSVLGCCCSRLLEGAVGDAGHGTDHFSAIKRPIR